MSSKMIRLMLAVFAGVALLTMTAGAQEEGTEKKEKKPAALLAGAVVSVDAAGGSFVVKSEGKDVTVKTGEKTKVSIMPTEAGKDATVGKIADLKAGSQVIVRHREGVAGKVMVFATAEAMTKALEEMKAKGPKAKGEKQEGAAKPETEAPKVEKKAE